jgi:hypothetical protein
MRDGARYNATNIRSGYDEMSIHSPPGVISDDDQEVWEGV